MPDKEMFNLIYFFKSSLGEMFSIVFKREQKGGRRDVKGREEKERERNIKVR